ncbi:MAG: MarR family transcriptional regulator [Pacificibacter sp.]|uniref:MarR family winged helix-turn-helix transcriptional regulator n=1 Tax=Pacificibacter sp. TaxID=1917866 RepID=UPI00321C2F90
MKKTKPDQSARIEQRRERERKNLFSRMPATYNASRLQAQRIMRHAGGLSIVEWRVLWDLFEAGPMTIRDLAELQRTDHSLLSRALPAMRLKGFVEMERDTADGRQVVIKLADAGREAYEFAAPIMKRRRDALHEMFSEEELDLFVDLLDRLEDYLRRPVDTIVERDIEND